MFSENWKELAHKLTCENVFDLAAFKELFTGTWRYFIENTGIRRHDVEVIRYMSAIPVHEQTPSNIPAEEFTAIVLLTGAFLDALAFSDTEKCFDSVLGVELENGQTFPFDLDKFDDDLAGLTEKCRK